MSDTRWHEMAYEPKEDEQYFHVTARVTIVVHAKDEEQAEERARDWFDDNVFEARSYEVN